MTSRITDVIHRVELPLDDRPHGIDLTQDILGAAVRRHDAVDVWFKARREDMQHMRRSFQIVATGQPIPFYLDRHQGIAISPDGQLVWHVLENYCPHESIAVAARGGEGRVGECQICRISLTQRTPKSAWIPV
ncbi:hypothetical protein [Streptomyces sp. NPDC005548]|uniref:DUF7352 domain-containing protein n=1 Tax=Streptomyces sp. NPDC005548 TaxID=3364724 RepID=UPI003686985F